MDRPNPANEPKQVLWIFPNFYDIISELPKSSRPRVWEAICVLGLGHDIDIEKYTKLERISIKLIQKYLKLRKIGGSLKTGSILNPDGKNGRNPQKTSIGEDNPYHNPKDNPQDNPQDKPLLLHQHQHHILTPQPPKGSSRTCKKTFVPPTLDEWLAFCRELKLNPERMRSVFLGYQDNNWHDSHGTQIKNWKIKIRQVWDKDENRDPDSDIPDAPRSYQGGA